MFIRALSPFDTQHSYRARKSAAAAVVVAAVAAGGDGLEDVPFLTTSAQEGKLETGRHCGASCSRLGPSRQTSSDHSPSEQGGGAPRGQTRDGR
jgi:hypothetical protein